MPSTRPPQVMWAVILTVVNAVGGVIFSAIWPDLEDRGTMVTVSIVAGLLMVLAAYFLWNGNKWGAIATLVLNGLNVLAAVPGFFDPEPTSLVVGVIVTIVLSVATIVLLLMPISRAFWNGANRLQPA